MSCDHMDRVSLDFNTWLFYACLRYDVSLWCGPCTDQAYNEKVLVKIPFDIDSLSLPSSIYILTSIKVSGI